MIALLGATGYIGRSLARILAQRDSRQLILFARYPATLYDEAWPETVELRSLEGFDAGKFELVINALGPGDPARVITTGPQIVEITQAWDSRVLATSGSRTRYVFLSSGAVYGTALERPVTSESVLALKVSDLSTLEPYTAAKLITELRHRSLPGLPILDVRIFGYADVTIPPEGTSFLAELARSVLRNAPFTTSRSNMIRDYAGATEIVDLIRCWESSGAPNAAVDVYSLGAVSKHELLQLIADRYGTEIRFVASAGQSIGGPKPVYASEWRAASDFGYEPRRSAAQVVLDTLEGLKAAHQL